MPGHFAETADVLAWLKENADGLYSLADVQQRFSKAIKAYDQL